jgi:hypothetical protein
MSTVGDALQARNRTGNYHFWSLCLIKLQVHNKNSQKM